MFINPFTKVLFICFCGFFLSLSAPGYDLWFIAWIGLSPLFIIINSTRSKREIVFLSFLFGFSYNFWYLHWLFSLHPLNWLGFSNSQSLLISSLSLIFVAAYNSLFFLLFALCLIWFKRNSIYPYNKGILSLLITAFIWLIIFNKIQTFKWLLGFPWTLIEYSQYKNLYLIQIAEYFGSISVSFLIVF